ERDQRLQKEAARSRHGEEAREDQLPEAQRRAREEEARGENRDQGLPGARDEALHEADLEPGRQAGAEDEGRLAAKSARGWVARGAHRGACGAPGAAPSALLSALATHVSRRDADRAGCASKRANRGRARPAPDSRALP